MDMIQLIKQGLSYKEDTNAKTNTQNVEILPKYKVNNKILK